MCCNIIEFGSKIVKYFVLFVIKVEVRVEIMDKGGNFIGWLFVDNINLSVVLVEEGLVKVYFTVERSNYYK